MEQTCQFAEARDEALRKTGRNVVSFQRMEALLRLLAVSRSFSGTAQEFVKIQVSEPACPITLTDSSFPFHAIV